MAKKYKDNKKSIHENLRLFMIDGIWILLIVMIIMIVMVFVMIIMQKPIVKTIPIKPIIK